MTSVEEVMDCSDRRHTRELRGCAWIECHKRTFEYPHAVYRSEARDRLGRVALHNSYPGGCHFTLWQGQTAMMADADGNVVNAARHDVVGIP